MEILEGTINREIKELKKLVAESLPITQSLFAQLENELCDSLEYGYNLYLENLNKSTKNSNPDNSTSSIFEQSKALLNWDFSQEVEQNNVATIFMDQIISMLHIPDAEKERILYIEKGLNFFKKGKSNSRFYSDSQQFYEKALIYDKSDYYVLYNLGLIHLFSESEMNIQKAEHYFEKAATYGFAEIDFVKLAFHKRESNFQPSINPLKLTVNALVYQARCLFILGKDEITLKVINKAIELDPFDTSSLFDKLKYHVAFKQTHSIEPLIAELLQLDRFMVLRIMKELELIQVDAIKNYLLNLKVNACKEAEEQILSCQAIIKNDSPFYKDLQFAKELLQKDNYLDATEALKILK